MCQMLARRDKICHLMTMNESKPPVPYTPSIMGLLEGARESLMTSIRPILREGGFTVAQWRVLRVLFDHSPCEPARLARHAQLHAPSVLRILKELSRRQLIVKEPRPQNSRRGAVLLSDSGRLEVAETMARIAPIVEFCALRFGRKRFAMLQKELAAFTMSISPEIYAEMTALPLTKAVSTEDDD